MKDYNYFDTNPPFILEALEYASKIHKHQTRNFGNEPYINHPIRVANNPEVLNYKWEGICVAFLHDCIEDADYPEEVDQYIQKNFPTKIYETVKLLTHNRLEKSYEEYIGTILKSGNEIAIAVKYADSLDNSVPTSSMDDKWIERCKKYKKNSEVYLDCLRETKEVNTLLKGN